MNRNPPNSRQTVIWTQAIQAPAVARDAVAATAVVAARWEWKFTENSLGKRRLQRAHPDVLFDPTTSREETAGWISQHRLQHQTPSCVLGQIVWI